MRKYYRAIAKARLREMGISNVNRKFSSGFSHAKERELQRKYPELLERILKKRQLTELWRRTLWGDIAKLYEKGKKRQNRRALRHG